MNTQTLHMNVYRAGFYHRQGKPGHCNIHAGDFFTTREDALANVEMDRGYIATIPFDMPIPEGVTILANPANSTPDPLWLTRTNPLELLPWHTEPDIWPPVLTAGLMCPTQKAAYVDEDSLDTSEGEARELPRTPQENWPFSRPWPPINSGLAPHIRLQEQQQQTAATYKPAHGGYPGVVRSK